MLYKFYSETCGPCKILEKNLQESKLDYININIDTTEGKELCIKYNIRSVPTLILVSDNEEEKEIKRNVGVLTVEGIKEFSNLSIK